MKYLISGLILILSTSQILSQTLDLIVTSKNDSIACKIDSTSSKGIHIIAKRNNAKIKICIKPENIKSIGYNVIDRKRIIPIQGQIYFLSKSSDVKSIYNIRQNSISLEIWTIIPSLVYTRVMPVSSKTGFTISGGVSLFGAFGTSTIIMGNSNHAFEIGGGLLGYFGHMVDDWNKPISPIIRGGYRYSARSGFIFRGFINFAIYDGDGYPLPSIAFGYGF